MHYTYPKQAIAIMNESLLQTIKRIAKTDIHRIVSEYTELSPSGQDYLGDCPFCKQAQSLAIAPKFGMFYCFGCQIGGDPITFLCLISNKTFEQIIIELATKYRTS